MSIFDYLTIFISSMISQSSGTVPRERKCRQSNSTTFFSGISLGSGTSPGRLSDYRGPEECSAIWKFPERTIDLYQRETSVDAMSLPTGEKERPASHTHKIIESFTQGRGEASQVTMLNHCRDFVILEEPGNGGRVRLDGRPHRECVTAGQEGNTASFAPS